MARAPVTMHAKLYNDPAFYQRERARIFEKSWLFAGHESQLKNPGDYVARRIADYPILVVKGEGGSVNAFRNFCRHRAHPLVEDGFGNCGAELTCPYHGWRYKHEGRLRVARDFGPADNFDARNFSLNRINTASWRGLVFVNLEKNPGPFTSFIAPLAARMQDMQIEGLRVHHAVSHMIACNWKVYVENYQEGYHIPPAHPYLDSQVISSQYKVTVVPPASFHEAPARDGSPVSGLWAWMWPCLGVNVYGDGGMMMETMSPVGHDHCRLDYLYLFPQGESEDVVQKAVAASEVTTREDIIICERVQRSLNSSGYKQGVLSPKHEMGVAWFQRQVLDATAHPLGFRATAQRLADLANAVRHLGGPMPIARAGYRL